MYLTIENSSGTELTRIQDVAEFQATHLLNAAGDFSFSIAASHPDAALIADDIVVFAYDALYSAGTEMVTEIAGGIVTSREIIATPNGDVLRVMCSDLLAELGRRSARRLNIYRATTVAAVAVWHESGGVWTDYSAFGAITLADGDYLYIVGDRPLTRLTLTVSGANTQTGSIVVSTHLEGEYQTFSVTDTTASGGIPFAVTGSIGPSGDLEFLGQTATDVETDYGYVWRVQWFGTAAAPTSGLNLSGITVGVTIPDDVDDVETIVEYNPGRLSAWTCSPFYNTATANGTMQRAAYGSLLQMLVNTADATNESFRRANGRTVDWLGSTFANSGAHATVSDDATGYPHIAAIESISVSYDQTRRATRVYPFGGPYTLESGQIQQLTLAPLAASPPAAPSGTTLAAGSNYLEVTGASPVIERRLDVPQIAPASATAGNVRDAAISMMQYCGAYLSAYGGAQTIIRLTCALRWRVRVGETIRVTYIGADVAGRYVTIDNDYIVLSLSWQYTGGGLRAAITCSNVARQPTTDALFTVLGLSQSGASAPSIVVGN